MTGRAEALSSVFRGEGGTLEIPSDSPLVLTQRRDSGLHIPPQGTRFLRHPPTPGAAGPDPTQLI